MVKTKIILVLVFLLSIMPIYSKPISFRENKVAFSVYDDEFEGDYVLDDYGLRDWFDANCPYKSVALGTITRNCKIIEL